MRGNVYAIVFSICACGVSVKAMVRLCSHPGFCDEGCDLCNGAFKDLIIWPVRLHVAMTMRDDLSSRSIDKREEVFGRGRKEI